MKQFNLDEYLKLKKEGKEPKIVTRNGLSVRIVCTDKLDDSGHPVVALVMYDEVVERIMSFSKDGFRYHKGSPSGYDIFFVYTEAKYRPYANAEECFADVKKHGGWVKDKYVIRQVVQIIFKEPQDTMYGLVQVYGCYGRTYEEFMTDFVWADDNSPCGAKVEG